MPTGSASPAVARLLLVLLVQGCSWCATTTAQKQLHSHCLAMQCTLHKFELHCTTVLNCIAFPQTVNALIQLEVVKKCEFCNNASPIHQPQITSAFLHLLLFSKKRSLFKQGSSHDVGFQFFPTDIHLQIVCICAVCTKYIMWCPTQS